MPLLCSRYQVRENLVEEAGVGGGCWGGVGWGVGGWGKGEGVE